MSGHHDHDHDHDHHDDCGCRPKKVEVDLCDLIMCGAKIGMKACKCKKKDCCAGIQASGSATQQVGDTDGQLAIMDQIDLVDQVKVVDDTTFEILCDGVYFIMASPQVGSDEQLSTLENFRCWVNVNGAPAANSNVLLNLAPGGITKDVIVSQGAYLLKKGDTVSVGVRSSAPQGVFLEAIQPSAEEPLVPSIIFTMVWECPPPKRPHR
jgi:hypothetical protein